MTREEKILERYSTPSLKQNIVSRDQKRFQLEMLNYSTQQIEYMLNRIYGEENACLDSTKENEPS